MQMSRKPKSINPKEIDPSIYYYDEVYDDMKLEEELFRQETREKTRDTKSASKYIQGLIETANERKSDKEVRKFKKYTKDREEAEARGELDDTDVYITSAYKRKLDEIKRIDANKKRRLEREKGDRLNFTKIPNHSDNLDTKNDINCSTSQKDTGTAVNTVDDSPDTSLVELPINPGKLKTPEERRQYLSKVLAKRTVGEAFESALERYWKRKQSYAAK